MDGLALTWQEVRARVWIPVDPDRPCFGCGAPATSRYPDGSPRYSCGPHPVSVASLEDHARFLPMILTELLTRRDSRMARAVEIRRPLRAHARKTDPPTSHAAAASVKSAAISELQEWILEVLDEPKTDEQIWNALVERHSGLTPSGVRTRRAELVDAGKIIDSRLRGHSAHGRMTIIWQRSDQALFGAA